MNNLDGLTDGAMRTHPFRFELLNHQKQNLRNYETLAEATLGRSAIYSVVDLVLDYSKRQWSRVGGGMGK